MHYAPGHHPNSRKNTFRLGHTHSSETRAKLAAAARQQVHSPKRNAKISLAVSGSRNPFFGKTHSPETRAKMHQKARRGSTSHFWKDGRSAIPGYISWLKARRSRLLKRIRVTNGSHSYQDWLTIKAMNANLCAGCGNIEPNIKLTEDHVTPLSKGGTDRIENIQPLCQPCNSRKSNKLSYTFA